MGPISVRERRTSKSARRQSGWSTSLLSMLATEQPHVKMRVPESVVLAWRPLEHVQIREHVEQRDHFGRVLRDAAGEVVSERVKGDAARSLESARELFTQQAPEAEPGRAQDDDALFWSAAVREREGHQALAPTLGAFLVPARETGALAAVTRPRRLRSKSFRNLTTWRRRHVGQNHLLPQPTSITAESLQFLQTIVIVVASVVPQPSTRSKSSRLVLARLECQCDSSSERRLGARSTRRRLRGF